MYPNSPLSPTTICFAFSHYLHSLHLSVFYGVLPLRLFRSLYTPASVFLHFRTPQVSQSFSRCRVRFCCLITLPQLFGWPRSPPPSVFILFTVPLQPSWFPLAGDKVVLLQPYFYGTHVRLFRQSFFQKPSASFVWDHYALFRPAGRSPIEVFFVISSRPVFTLFSSQRESSFP